MFPHDVSTPSVVLTPRQDRLERAITKALRARSTRSELRTAVHELVDFFRLQGVTAARGVSTIRMIALHAIMGADLADSEHEPAGDGRADRLAMVARWATERYRRDD